MKRLLICAFLVAATGCTDEFEAACERYAVAQKHCAAELGDAVVPEGSTVPDCASSLRDLNDDDSAELSNFERYVDCFEEIDCSERAKAIDGYLSCGGP